MKRAPLGKTDPEPMEEEADTDEEEGTMVSPYLLKYPPKLVALSDFDYL